MIRTLTIDFYVSSIQKQFGAYPLIVQRGEKVELTQILKAALTSPYFKVLFEDVLVTT